MPVDNGNKALSNSTIFIPVTILILMIRRMINLADLKRDLIKILSVAGCEIVRQGKGDHVIWYSPITKLNFPVDSGITSRHTANAILKQAGLPKQF